MFIAVWLAQTHRLCGPASHIPVENRDKYTVDSAVELAVVAVDVRVAKHACVDTCHLNWVETRRYMQGALL